MTFDPTVGLGSLIVLVTMVVGGVGAWFTLKAEYKDSAKRIADLEARAGRAEGDQAAHRLHISETYVRRDDLEKLEDRLAKLFGGMVEAVGKRMETVEHQLRNIDTKILSFLTLKGRNAE